MTEQQPHLRARFPLKGALLPGCGGEDTTAGHAEFHPQLGVVPVWRWPRHALCPAPLHRVIPAPRAGSAPASRGVLLVSHRLRRGCGCLVVPEALRGKGRGGPAGEQSPARPPRVQGFCSGDFCPSPGGSLPKALVPHTLSSADLPGCAIFACVLLANPFANLSGGSTAALAVWRGKPVMWHRAHRCESKDGE